MPYQNTSELPPEVQRLPRKGQLAFKAVFNREYAKDRNEERAYKCACDAAIKTCNIESYLAQSMQEEAQASADYHARGETAKLSGDPETAALYEHIAADEDTHYSEFSERLQSLEENGIKMFAVKFFDEEAGIVEGLGIPYGGPMRLNETPEGRDLQGEFFNSNTDFRSEYYDGNLLIATKSMPELYHHGIDPELKNVPIGHVIDAVETPVGKWVRAQLDKANKYYGAIKQLIKAGALRWSSGADPPGVVKTLGGYIEKWPWIEMSLTPTAANPLATASFKSLIEELPGAACNENNMEVVMNEKTKAVKAEETKPPEPENDTPAPVEKTEDKKPEETPTVKSKSIKCAACGKSVQLPQPVIDALTALIASAQDIISGGDGSGEQTAQEAPPAAPSQPGVGQGMSPENHESPKEPTEPPEEESSETPAHEVAETPEEEKKENAKTVTPEAMKALFDDMLSKVNKGVEEAVKPLKERIETLEKQPVKSPPLRAVKAINPKMGDTGTSSAMDFYDNLLKDPNISPTTRMEIARKSAEESLLDVFNQGPQPPRHN